MIPHAFLNALYTIVLCVCETYVSLPLLGGVSALTLGYTLWSNKQEFPESGKTRDRVMTKNVIPENIIL